MRLPWILCCLLAVAPSLAAETVESIKAGSGVDFGEGATAVGLTGNPSNSSFGSQFAALFKLGQARRQTPGVRRRGPIIVKEPAPPPFPKNHDYCWPSALDRAAGFVIGVVFPTVLLTALSFASGIGLGTGLESATSMAGFLLPRLAGVLYGVTTVMAWAHIVNWMLRQTWIQWPKGRAKPVDPMAIVMAFALGFFSPPLAGLIIGWSMGRHWAAFLSQRLGCAVEKLLYRIWYRL